MPGNCSILFGMNKSIAILAGLLGVIFVGVAVMYWMTPAGALPPYLPGFAAGSAHMHFKHGLASLILGAGLFVFAWFKSAPAKSLS